MKKKWILLFVSLASILVQAQTTVFSDDFSTNTNSTWTTSGTIGSSAWSVTRSGDDWGARRNTSPEQLELTNDAGGAANANGWIFTATTTSSFNSPYNTTLNLNPGIVTWNFNMRQIRTDPAGFASNSYGVAFVLAGSSNSLNNTGNGYAIVLGQSGTTDPIRLAYYTTGLQGTLTNIITSNTTGLTDFGTEYLSIRVTYNPSNDIWELFVRNDGTTSFSDPLTGTLISQGTAINNTYTGIPLDYLGGYWQGSTAANQTAFFDNVSVSVTIIPVTNIQVNGTGTGTGSVSWTSPNIYNNSLNELIVFLKDGSSITVGTPTSNISSYTANSIFGSGSTYENDPNAYCIYKGDGTSINISGIIDGNTYYTLIFNTNSQSSYSSAATGNGILPVELSSFSAIVLENSVKLNWRTETEVSNYGFEIERASSLTTPVQEWTKIGFVQGYGNSNSPKDYSFIDDLTLTPNLPAGRHGLNRNLQYRLKQIDNDGQFEYSKVIEVDLGSPTKFELSQNYPNPFNPSTTISFSLPQSGNVKLTVYNLLGEQIAEPVNGFKEAGIHTINFSASSLNSGIYIYKIEANGFVQSRKMTLIK
jgi:hypothetical protein